jgi:hypothetical protein
MVIFPVFAFLLVQINALRYRSESITRVRAAPPAVELRREVLDHLHLADIGVVMGNAARDMLHGESLDPTLTHRLGNMSCRNLNRRRV